MKRIKRIHKNIIYCHSVFPPRFPDLRWPHCTPYRLYKKFFPIFLTLFVPPLQTYEVMLPRSKLMCSLFYCLLSLPLLLFSVEEYLVIFTHLTNVIVLKLLGRVTNSILSPYILENIIYLTASKSLINTHEIESYFECQI